jgi:lysophospholipase L1-like esterase
MLGRRGAFAAIVIAVALVAAGCLPTPSAWTGSGTHVAFVGDSITYNTEHDALNDTNHHLTDALVTSGYAVSSSDMIGANSTDLAGLAAWPAPGASIVSIEIGTNDMHATNGQPATPYATAEANYNTYLTAQNAAGVRCVVLVEISETTPWGLDVTGPVWNAFLASVAALRPAGSTDIVPWAEQTAAHPEYLGSDGVHPTAAGKVALIDDITQAMNTCAANAGDTQ